MDHLEDCADARLINGCIYCGGPDDTKDHVPSRIFLDSPLPAHPPVVGACRTCNNGFSLDEEYVACLLESVIAGSTDPERIRRPKIAKALQRNIALRARIEGAKNIVDGQVQFNIESERVKNVFLKLARGHAAYELSQVCNAEPAICWWHPLHLLTKEQRGSFEEPYPIQTYGEVGSRWQQRIQVIQIELQGPDGKRYLAPLFVNDWVEVQTERYRYNVIDDTGEIKIKIVIAEYLACEIMWTQQL